MQFLNKNMHGHQEVGHIDLLSKFSYIEVPKGDARKVMKALNGAFYKGREVRCNDADDTGHGRSSRGGSRDDKGASRGRKERENSRKARSERTNPKEDWRDLMNGAPFKFKGEEPDFSEEGWARRRPKKK